MRQCRTGLLGEGKVELLVHTEFSVKIAVELSNLPTHLDTQFLLPASIAGRLLVLLELGQLAPNRISASI